MNISKVVRPMLCILMLSLVTIAYSKDGTSVVFSNEKVEEAMSRASSEGKLVFLDFYAAWCTPCKWMDKTTFADGDVADAIGKSFIAVKVNIDDAAGFELKNKYEINYLPTMLILNSKGQLVERVEETLTASSLLSLLAMHDHEENKVMIKHHFNTSPKNIDKENDSKLDPWKISKEDYHRYTTEQRNYKVQVGVYSDYKAVRDRVEYLRTTFFEPVVVVNDYREGKVLFKVMLGQFESMSEADSFRKILQSDFEIEGIVY